MTFEVERFEWASDDRLEVVGRWFGLRGHRFLRPTLDVEVRGERRRMLAVLEHKPWAAEEGEEWMAAFAWAGDQAQLDEAELTVSPDLAVQLPLPDGPDEAGDRSWPRTAERRPARRPRTAVLEDELAAALAEVQPARRGAGAAARDALRDDARAARARADRAGDGEAAGDRARAARAGDRRRGGGGERGRRPRRSGEELDAMREERDAATADRNRAEAEAEAARADRDDAL